MTKHAEKVDDIKSDEVDTKPVDVNELQEQQAERHANKMDGLIEGRIVHFVMPNGDHRPAIVVNAWSDLSAPCDGYVNLQVFTDGRNDAQNFSNQNQVNEVEGGTFWVTSVCFDADTKPARSWHWIERA